MLLRWLSSTPKLGLQLLLLVQSMVSQLPSRGFKMGIKRLALTRKIYTPSVRLGPRSQG